MTLKIITHIACVKLMTVTKGIFCTLLLLGTFFANAQDPGGSKTIDITSSFKPSLLPPKKMVPVAAPAPADGKKSALVYDLPVQLLNFRYVPSALRPLAFSDTLLRPQDNGYVKAGFGNFSTPFVQAAMRVGDGTKLNGNVEGWYTSSKGKLPYQQFASYGIKGQMMYQLDENHLLQGRGGYNGKQFYRYGYRPDSLIIPKDSLKLNYSDIHLGATLGNRKANDYGVYYKAILDAHFFSDNNSGTETSLQYELPLEKALNEKINMLVGLQGVVSKVNFNDTSFSNNLIQVKAGADVKLNEQITFTAALIPSWNNGNFSLLPLAQIEAFLEDKNLVLQGGIQGGYVQNTWRSLAGFNPWIAQPGQVTHSRYTEFFGAAKGSLTEQVSFRIKGSFQKRYNTPLYVNDEKDGRTFLVRWEPSMNITAGTGELIWQKGDNITWTNSLTVQSFGGLEQSSKAYGWSPFEFTSSFRGRFFEKLVGKADLFQFSAPWVRNNGKAEKGEGGLDLNLGAEFEVMPQLKAWLQFNNLLNDKYQRWNQYEVLGFQAVGGIILTF